LSNAFKAPFSSCPDRNADRDGNVTIIFNAGTCFVVTWIESIGATALPLPEAPPGGVARTPGRRITFATVRFQMCRSGRCGSRYFFSGGISKPDLAMLKRARVKVIIAD
jgi:hypothetical protein